jgi:hypothetical protein
MRTRSALSSFVVLALLPSCASLAPKREPTAQAATVSKAIADKDREKLQQICDGKSFVTGADKDRACAAIPQLDGSAIQTLAALPCTAFDPLPDGNENNLGPEARLGTKNMVPHDVAMKLKTCGRYEDLLNGRFVGGQGAAGFVFTEGPGVAYLVTALDNKALQDLATSMIVSVLDPKAENKDDVELIAGRVALAEDPSALAYLALAKHPRAVEWLPKYLDAALPARRILGCRAAKQLGASAKTLSKQIERLALHDPEMTVEGLLKVWPVREECEAALASLE